MSEKGLKDKLMGAVGKLTGKTEAETDQILDDVVDKGKEVVEKGKDVVEKGKDTVEDLVDKAQDVVGDVVGDLKEKFDKK